MQLRRNRSHFHFHKRQKGSSQGTLILYISLQLFVYVSSTGAGSRPGKNYNFTLAFLTAVQNRGQGKFIGGAFFLALNHLNNATQQLLDGSGNTATFRYEFRDTHNQDTTAARTMVDLFCSEVDVTAFIGPDVFCNSAALLATSFHLPFLSYDCNDIHTLRTNIGKYLMVNLEPSLAYVAKSIVAVMLHYEWRSFWLITGTGNTTNAWADTGQYLRILARQKGITFNDVTRVALNDEFHIAAQSKKPYPKIIRDTRYKTRVYVFLGNYNSLLDFLRDLNREGVTSKGEHVVIAVDDRTTSNTEEDYFLRLDERGQSVTTDHLQAFRNVLLISRLQSAPAAGEDFRHQVYEMNYRPPINLKRIPDWWQGSKFHALLQESFYLYDAVMHYGHAVLDLIVRGLDPYNASLVVDKMRNTTFKSIQGFDVRINEHGESEGRYVVRSTASDSGGLVADLWQVGTFLIHGNGTAEYLPTNNTVTWVTGQVPISDPICGFDGSKCATGETSEWKLVAIGIGLSVTVLLALGAIFVGLRYMLIVRRMRGQALAAARAVCPNSFVELQEHDREGLLLC